MKTIIFEYDYYAVGYNIILSVHFYIKVISLLYHLEKIGNNCIHNNYN